MDQDIPQKLVDMEKDEPLRMHNSFMWLKEASHQKKLFCTGNGFYDNTQPPSSQLIGRVNALWMVQKPGNQSSYFFHTTLFRKLDKNGIYRMR
ncbi:hypothetical protein MJO29_010189 [Puccinia striiformis f. sp. tritici]|nr:hypothetical protein MJO29_010186 [Puccinia striiformis f. sp. tritici]KAI7948524.1 hypothetical protein MJO29_010189 [Puccinia striiformis f. sp. tritici]